MNHHEIKALLCEAVDEAVPQHAGMAAAAPTSLSPEAKALLRQFLVGTIQAALPLLLKFLQAPRPAAPDA